MSNIKAAAALRKTAIFCAVLLAVFRIVILQASFDKEGLLPRGSMALPLTVLLCAVCFAVMCVLALKLNGRPGREAFFSVQGIWLPLKLIGAGLLLAGSIMTLRGMERLSVASAETLISAAGIVSALLMGWSALRERRGTGFFWVRLVPALFTGAALVLRFRAWSYDPMIIHIIPLLLAWVCCMVEMMLLTGFSLNVGHRRSGALFGLSAGVFVCMAIPDFFLSDRIALSDFLTVLGVAFWCVVAALELLRRRTQKN